MPESGFKQPIPPIEANDARTLIKVLDELPDAVIIIDAQGRLHWVNRTTERLFGRSLHELIGMSGFEFLHPEDQELVLRSLVSVHGKEIGTPIEVRLNTAAGWRLMELIGVPAPWLEDGAVLLSVRDLTERRRFELAGDHDARFRSLVQNSAALTMLVSPEGLVNSVSGALTRLLGHDPEAVEGRPLAELVCEDDRSELASALDRAARGASSVSPVTVTLGLLRYGNTGTVSFELALVNLIDDPTVGGFVISGHDVTARAFAELELRKTLSLLTATLDATADGILVVDTAGRFTSFNHRFTELWRLPDSILEQRDDVKTIEFVRNQLERPEAFVAKVDELYAHPESESYDILYFKDGRVFERFSKPQRLDDVVVGRVWSFRDVTERKHFEEQLEYQAFHDSLTGLGNRVLFQDRLKHAIERIQRTHGHLAVLFLDVDNFKFVNDSQGHSLGDALLQAIAEVLVGCLRKADTAARLGGDEFGVILEELADPREAINLAERIVSAVRRPWTVGTQEVSATVSIGVAFDGLDITGDQMLCNADLAMYAAKERGKNQIAEFEDEMQTALVATP
jgi:diguanylate cyclase (GGDEF)-like protein/PAS domain S-box-containing protein